MIDAKAMGRRIYARRKAMKLSQVDVGVMGEVDRSFVSKMETGEKLPSLETLYLLSEGMNVSIGYLLGEVSLDQPYQIPNDAESAKLVTLWKFMESPDKLRWLRMMEASLDFEAAKTA